MQQHIVRTVLTVVGERIPDPEYPPYGKLSQPRRRLPRNHVWPHTTYVEALSLLNRCTASYGIPRIRIPRMHFTKWSLTEYSSTKNFVEGTRRGLWLGHLAYSI